jgi:hypothetical protein
MDVHERRRIVLASALTLVALPTLWLLDRDDPAASPNVAAAGMPTPVVTAAGPTVTSAPEMPVFLDPNGAMPAAPVVASAATAPPAGDNEIVGKGTFKRFQGATVPSCTVRSAPGGALITVTNIDNGLSLTCTNDLSVTTLGGVIVTIDTDLYLTIANLVDTPVPVRVDW